MSNFNERNHTLVTGEYDRCFWDVMKGCRAVSDTIAKGSDHSGGYYLPSDTEDKLGKAIAKESIFRSLCTVIRAYNGSSRIFAKDCEDFATWVPEGGSIPIYDAADDFTNYPVDTHKLAVFVKLDDAFILDDSFDIKDFLVKRLAKNFARGEDAAFVNGTGENEPIGLLADDDGASIGVTANAITYESITDLYFSLDPEYRSKAVWMMNDTTALAIRRMKDDGGNYIWNHNDNTIFGHPVVISNEMPSAGHGNKPILFGDFSYYWIICRRPVSVRALKEKFITVDQIGYLAMEFMDARLVRHEAI